MPEGVGYGPQNTASVGKEIHVIGNHAYGFSGLFDSATSEYTMFEFTSGNYYLVGELTVSGAIDDTSPAVGLISVFTLSMNGTNLMFLKADTDGEKSPMTISMPILIPPFTVVKLVGIDTGAVSARQTCASLVGRIYGKID